ncbi:hypothetical protein WH47_04098 [Habropoda laboriosa]|uniref:Uncharacterized protein n=1 Tax=Habropoda laboriosa TaxID=597456 RepID=A0A0L7QXP3_9HYME|nr:hypothetical protein WH47_04098 [Habropoda laboriosa]
MELWNFIRNIFGGQNFEEPKNKWFFDHHNNYDKDNFENLIWQNDDDDDNIDNSRYFKRRHHFEIFNNPLEMTRYFEFQIDNIICKNIVYIYLGDDATMNMLPFSSPQKEQLRDQMLKQDNDEISPKLDIVLDGKVTADNFSDVWDEYNHSKVESSKPFIITKSMKREYIHRPDGIIQQKQVIRDSEGNEETIVSKQVGDKMHTIITKRDKSGVETTTENFCDINECK